MMDTVMLVFGTVLGGAIVWIWTRRQLGPPKEQAPPPEVIQAEALSRKEEEPPRTFALYQHPPGQRIQDYPIVSKTLFQDPARSMTVPLKEVGDMTEDRGFVKRWLRGEETIERG